MMTYRCRFVIPGVSDWHEVSADSPEEAANEFHSWYVPEGRGAYASLRYYPDDTRPAYTVMFARVEVEDHGVLISRMYWTGITRRGGVRSKHWVTHLDDIAARLGWTHPPEELLASDGWQGEEQEWR
ncbi:MAG TPA: hypothetical protein VFO62_10545 [Candidatus Binatia bacterium]|nr:hypothetical protein [Candidatus Binatia bacterium]